MPTSVINRVRLTVASLVCAAAVVVPGSPAQAAIGICGGYWASGSSWSGLCSGSGPSTFRSWLTCYPWNGGSAISKAGPWRIAGGALRSVATCPSGYDAAGPWIETHV